MKYRDLKKYITYGKDNIDYQLLNLISQRAKKVAKIKLSKDPKTKFYSEAQVLRNKDHYLIKKYQDYLEKLPIQVAYTRGYIYSTSSNYTIENKKSKYGVVPV